MFKVIMLININQIIILYIVLRKIYLQNLGKYLDNGIIWVYDYKIINKRELSDIHSITAKDNILN